MKYLILTILTLFAATTIPAAAGCVADGFGDSPLDKDSIGDKLSGKRIIATAHGGDEEWKEDHCSTGALYKVGAGTAVDPRKKVGTWGTETDSGHGVVVYDYETTDYEFKLYENDEGALCWESKTGDIVVATTVSEPEDIPDGSACSSSP